jgi:hypothetical protein
MLRQKFKEYHASLAIDEADVAIWLLIKRQHLVVDVVYVVGVYNFAVVVEETERISHLSRHR